MLILQRQQGRHPLKQEELNKRLTPVFIGGTGRSGTTILKRIFDKHPQTVSIPYELRLLIDPDGVLDLIRSVSDDWSPCTADLAIRRFEKLVDEIGGIGKTKNILDALSRRNLWPSFLTPRRYSRWNIGGAFGREFYKNRINELVRKLNHYSGSGRWLGSPPFRTKTVIRECEVFDEPFVCELVASCFEDLYRNIKSSNLDATHWVDDSPYNLLFADRLLTTFPNSKFIHIFRDPRDVLASYFTKIWGGDDYEMTARRLAAIYKKWLRIREQLPTDRFLEIGLERTIDETESTLLELSEFVGLPFHPETLQVDLSRGNRERWREIPESELVKSIVHLGPAVDLFGYRRNYS